MIKNNPHTLLEQSNIPKNLLTKNTREALKIFDESVEGLKEFPEDTSLKEMTEEIGKAAIELLKEDLDRIQSEIRDEAKEAEKKHQQKAQSKKLVEKASKTMDYLEECRIKLREERKRKLEAGEIKAPVKKTLTTKLKDSMKRIVGMMPKEVKKDEKKIRQTEEAIGQFLSNLKTIWGMNKIRPIEKELQNQFQDLKEKAANT